jgi:chromosomal replication initiator protein
MLNLDWNAAIHQLKEVLPPTQFQNWVKPVSFLRSGEKSIVLGVPSRFHEEWVRQHYTRQITEALKKQTGAELQLEFEVLVEEENQKAAETSLLVAPNPPQRPTLRIVDGGATPQTPPPTEEEVRPVQMDPGLPHITTPFMELGFNRMALEFSRHFSKVGRLSFPCLTIYGGVGMGKTHLLAEIGLMFQNAHPTARVRYVSAESFGSEYVRALKSNSLADFKWRYSQLDCLLFDDFHQFSGPKFQESLLFIFNEITNRGGRVAFASSQPISRINDIIEPLRSRLQASMACEIRPPNYEERVELLSRACEHNRIAADGTVLRRLAGQCKNDVRGIVSSLVTLHLQSTISQQPMDEALNQVEQERIEQPSRDPITLNEIVALVEHNFQISRSDLVSKSRKEGPTWARQVAMYLARTYTLLPLEEIGAFFGRDHATVVHAFQKVVDSMENHQPKRYQVEFLKKKLHARAPGSN